VLLVVSLAGSALAQSWQAGDKLPNFSIKSTDGKTLSRQDLLSDGPIFLYFIQDGDGVNNLAMPWITRIISSYVPGHARWYGVFSGRSDRADSWTAEFNPPFRLLLDTDLTVVKTLHVKTSPTVIQVDSSGAVVDEWSGYSGYYLKALNRAMAKANGMRPAKIDFRHTPSTTRYGMPYIMASTRTPR
jgi:hypothetical protein